MDKTNTKTKLNAGILLILAAILVVLDQVTKFLAVSHLKDQPSISLIPGVLELQYLENRGAAFSMLVGQQWFFYILTTIFLLLVIWFLRKVPKTKKFDALVLTVTVLAAGAIGNLIDRVVNQYVVDFIYFSLIDFPVFNVADIYVTLGVIVLIILIMFCYKDEDIKEIFPKA